MLCTYVLDLILLKKCFEENSLENIGKTQNLVVGRCVADFWAVFDSAIFMKNLLCTSTTGSPMTCRQANINALFLIQCHTCLDKTGSIKRFPPSVFLLVLAGRKGSAHECFYFTLDRLVTVCC